MSLSLPPALAAALSEARPACCRELAVAASASRDCGGRGGGTGFVLLTISHSVADIGRESDHYMEGPNFSYYLIDPVGLHKPVRFRHW